jgi:integrase
VPPASPAETKHPACIVGDLDPRCEGLGQAINPHLFRDCAATSIAIDDPDHVRIASPLLGHRAISTTENYYNQVRSVEASRLMQNLLLSLRRGAAVDLTVKQPEPEQPG